MVLSIVVITVIRIRLQRKSKELTEKINSIYAYSGKPSNVQAQERASKLNDAIFVDIPTDLNNEFQGKIISATQETDFTNHYKSGNNI